MRIKLTLKASEKNPALPINYQYPLSAAIYKILNKAEPQFAELLHSKGYPTTHNRRFKFFTFSKLFFRDRAAISDNKLILQNGEHPQLLVSSPLDESFIQNFVIGIFESQELPIGLREICHTTFRIEQVETLPEPKITNDIRCKALGPISISVAGAYKHPDYLKALDGRLSECIRENLLWKYKTLYEAEPSDKILKFETDMQYIKNRGGENKVSKLIKIKEGEPEETSVRGFIVPFKMTGSIELIKLAYQCGIGEKNSLGFGMFEVTL
ncbi:MAG: CRISPR-associated endoribonuclease Cas6 [Bacteroidota bacterium]|nr:CRISPR-associated endoribonuclease Cas6 [Bacteroidota bacterium]